MRSCFQGRADNYSIRNHAGTFFCVVFLVSLDNGADTRAREALSQVWKNQAATCGALENENNAELQHLNWTLKANLPVYRLVGKKQKNSKCPLSWVNLLITPPFIFY